MYRYERSGTMHGLFRVRGFTQVGSGVRWQAACYSHCRHFVLVVVPCTCAHYRHPATHIPRITALPRPPGLAQDDAHIFCLRSQIADEIRGVLDLTQELLSTFGFHKYEVRREIGK